MKRRDFLTASTLGAIGLGAGALSPASASATAQGTAPETSAGIAAGRPAVQNPDRKILIAGGGFGTVFIKYLAQLTGKERPRLCYLPTASADSAPGAVRWFQNCAPLQVEPHVQNSFISSYGMEETWEEALLSMDGIVVSGGNTLNQQAIWRAQGIDEVLRQAWNRGIVLGGASAGSLCWFEEGTTDSRPQQLTKVECLGFLQGSHSPHYDGEEQRRPTYQQMILSGEMKPGYACDNDAGIFFVDNRVERVVHTREDAKVYYVGVAGGEIIERELEAEMIE
ncbi:MAG: peptidase E [Acidobacteriota bacterium]|jgi:peptidase E